MVQVGGILKEVTGIACADPFALCSSAETIEQNYRRKYLCRHYILITTEIVSTFLLEDSAFGI